jgi:hypothetical protein
LSDLIDKIEWAKNNDDLVQQISKNAQIYAKEVFSDAAIDYYQLQTILDYNKVFQSPYRS